MTRVDLSQITQPLLWLITIFVSLSTSQSHATAVACQATMTDMDFGVVDFVNSPLLKTNTGTLVYHCVNHSPVVQYINACFYLGETPLSSTSNASWFTMQNEASTAMLFRLKNAVTGEMWGTKASQLPMRVMRSLPGNSEISGNISIRGELLSNQKNVAAGSYHSQFSTHNSSMTWSESPTILPNTCLEQTAPQPLEFTASALIQKSCSISAQDIDFGQVRPQDDHNIDAQGDITIECTNNTQYRIALRSVNRQNGQFYLYPLRSEGKDNEKIAYSLYQDPARMLLWSDNNNEKTEQGSGGRQVHRVYGRVSTGPAGYLRAGTYQDTVIVTLSF